jgi:hypothetical protein
MTAPAVGADPGRHGFGRLTAVLAYSFFAALLLEYLILTKHYVYPHPAFFWVPILGLLLVILYQILTLRKEDHWEWAILAQMAVFALLLRFVFILPIPSIFGNDSYREVRAASEMAAGGWALSGPAYDAFPSQFNNPVLHFFGIASSQVTGLSLFDFAKWLPALYTLPTLLFVYLIGWRLHGSKRAALFASFGFSTLYMYILFHSLFVREGLAFVLFAAAIYSYYVGARYRRFGFIALALVFSGGTVFAHHLTPLAMILLVGVLAVSASRSAGSQTERAQRTPSGSLEAPASGRSLVGSSFPLLLAVATFGYWLYLTFSPLDSLTLAIKDATSVRAASADFPGTIKNQILLGGEIGFAAVFGSLALLAIVLKGRKASAWDFALLSWGIAMGLISLGMFNRIVAFAQLGTTFMAARFQTFGYLALFLMAGYGIARAVNRSRALGVVAALPLVAYALLGVYRIPQYLYSEGQPSFEAGEQNLYLTLPELHAYLWIEGGGRVAAGQDSIATDDWSKVFFASLIGAREQVYSYDWILTPAARERGALIERFDYVFWRENWRYQMEESLSFVPTTLPALNHIYANGDISIFKSPVGPDVVEFGGSSVSYLPAP